MRNFLNLISCLGLIASVVLRYFYIPPSMTYLDLDLIIMTSIAFLLLGAYLQSSLSKFWRMAGLFGCLIIIGEIFFIYISR